jgi:hypothetical protein
MVVDDHSRSLENLAAILSVLVQVRGDSVPMVRDCSIDWLEYCPPISVGEELRTRLHQQQVGFSDRPLIKCPYVLLV